MPDDILISELSNAPQIDDSAVFPFSQDNGGTLATFKGSMSDIAGKVAEGTTFINLETTAKNLVGAINEAAQSGGGSTDIISEASGAIATFNDGGDNIPVKSLVTDIVAVQSGTGTPSPSNVRAITGFSSINLRSCGKNIYELANLYTSSVGGNAWSSITTSLVKNANNEVTGISINGTAGTGSASASYVLLDNLYLRAGTYILSRTDTSNCVFRLGFNATNINHQGTYVVSIPESGEYTFTVSTAGYYNVSIGVVKGTSFNATVIPPMIRVSGNDTYEPYTGTTHTITLPETIYKGEVDVANGKGTKTFNAIDLGDLSYTYDSTNTRMVAVISDLKSTGTRRTSFVCSCFQTIDDGRELVNVPNNSVYSGNVGNTQVYIQTTDYTDPAAFKTAMVGQTLVYPIEDTDIVFSPVNVPTLAGLNNIYSNTGDVEVEYFNENADQTSELIDAKQEFCNYSSEEKVVGKWLDGSPLYEKTLYFNNVKLDKADNTSGLVHGVKNIGSVRFVTEVYFDFSGGTNGWSPANNGLWNNGVYNFYWVVGATSIWILSTSGVYFDANPNRSYLVKIRYTKA